MWAPLPLAPWQLLPAPHPLNHELKQSQGRGTEPIFLFFPEMAVIVLPQPDVGES